ncbi:CheR family methyltransferase [Klenkia terrae]|uniref:CheR family methyltransferase n=1 Tax=Klenkia terrae TaxID=1052259 RepID=UPI0036148881
MTTALATPGFDWVCQLVRRESAIVLAPGKEYLVEARLMPLARQLGLSGVSELVERCRARPDPATNRRIVEALTTNETSWFRDGDPFTALTSTVMPALQAARRPTDPITIWSAACSSGQEAYTIGMLLADSMPGAASRVRITATDLSRDMVARTRAGRFSQLEVNRGCPPPCWSGTSAGSAPSGRSRPHSARW